MKWRVLEVGTCLLRILSRGLDNGVEKNMNAELASVRRAGSLAIFIGCYRVLASWNFRRAENLSEDEEGRKGKSAPEM